LVGGLTYIGRWYVPILVTMRTYIGQPADQYRLLLLSELRTTIWLL